MNETPASVLVSAPGMPTCAGVDLVAEMEALPAHPTAAMRVLFLAENPNSSASHLGGVVGTDPSLTAKIMKVANSAYYGLSGRVASATFAITVLGFDTVRAIAAATAAGITGDSGTLPDGFWSHAASCAVACSLVSPRLSIRAPEGFSLGLLHDIGAALLHRSLGPLPVEAPSETANAARVALEQQLWGIDHATAAARVLAAWWFPQELTRALAAHHGPLAEAGTPLARALIAGEALAACAEGDAAPEDVAEALSAANLDAEAVPALCERVRAEADGLGNSLASL
jgi:HD-like signal output (HDOD) protein